MPQTVITKTDFVAYLDAPRHLWAIKHNKLDKKQLKIFIQHLFQQGYEVEQLAKKYIQTHLVIKYRADKDNVLFQPTKIDTSEGNFEARTDVLIKNPETGKWDMYEIKSTNDIDKTHKYDITFQALVFEKFFDLGDLYILHLNKDYVRQGKLNLQHLFTVTNMNDIVTELRDEVRQLRYEAYLIAQANSYKNIPACIRPKTCPCLELCHPDLPEYSIYDVNMLTGNEKKIRDLENQGVISVYDIPHDFPLSKKQRLQVDVAQSGKPLIQQKQIQEKLSELVYPLYFLDYESYNPAIPMYDGFKPYDQMPFQYSLHVLREPNGKLEHYEFIETKPVDPTINLLKNLKEIIGYKGSIIVWNRSFEATQNTRMGEIHPTYANFCENMNNRIFDLMAVFRDQLYIHPKFKGSYSIKKGLPVLVPDLTYEGMDIGDGATAMISWKEMVYGNISKEQKNNIKQNLLRYCELDTLAMVKVWEVIKKV